METYTVRVWLPDRPGALGAVASRIGAVRGEIVGIEILERGGGRAVDDLVVELPDGASLDLLASEIGQVDGVDVEDVKPVGAALHDPRLDALETAAQLVAAASAEQIVAELCERAAVTIGAQWAAVVDLDALSIKASVGPAPELAWLAAFVHGSKSSARVAAMETGPDDVLWAPLPAANLALLMGRDGQAFRARERRTAAALARIVDTRFRELAALAARLNHPSTTA
jgi:ACT domain